MRGVGVDEIVTAAPDSPLPLCPRQGPPAGVYGRADDTPTRVGPSAHTPERVGTGGRGGGSFARPRNRRRTGRRRVPSGPGGRLAWQAAAGIHRGPADQHAREYM